MSRIKFGKNLELTNVKKGGEINHISLNQRNVSRCLSLMNFFRFFQAKFIPLAGVCVCVFCALGGMRVLLPNISSLGTNLMKKYK